MILKKKIIVIATLLRKLQAVKDLVRSSFKKTVLEDLLTLDMLMDPKPL